MCISLSLLALSSKVVCVLTILLYTRIHSKIHFLIRKISIVLYILVTQSARCIDTCLYYISLKISIYILPEAYLFLKLCFFEIHLIIPMMYCISIGLLFLRVTPKFSLNQNINTMLFTDRTMTRIIKTIIIKYALKSFHFFPAD